MICHLLNGVQVDHVHPIILLSQPKHGQVCGFVTLTKALLSRSDSALQKSQEKSHLHAIKMVAGS